MKRHIARPAAALALLYGLIVANSALAEPMKLTVNQAFSVSIGIEQLNKGATQIIKDGAKETQAQTPSPSARAFASRSPSTLRISATRSARRNGR